MAIMKTFTIVDKLEGRCLPAEIGHPWELRWGLEEVRSRLCEMEDLGKPRPEPEPEPETLPLPLVPIGPLEKIPSKRLRQDVMAVYESLGGAEYLRKMAMSDPNQFNKLLMKILPQAIEADIRSQEARQDIKNLTLDQLKVMALEHLRSGSVIEAEFVDISNSLNVTL